MIKSWNLLDLLICPNCSGTLASFQHCGHCEFNFLEMDGLPALFPTNGKKTVVFQFEQSRSVRSSSFENCFAYPTRCGATGTDKPHHLDDAHLAVIERLSKHSTVLEIGCGSAQMREYIEAAGHRYIGTDISPIRVNKNPQQHSGPDILCDAHFLPFADQSIDLVYSSALTEHLACPYLAAQQVARCLKPGGYYLGNVSFLEPWHADSFFHMTPLGVYELLTQADFDIKNIWPGKGYSGYRAILLMGNKITKPLAFVGGAIHFIYASANRLRNFVKRRNNWATESIADAARVSGATDWIARKPVKDTEHR